VNKAWFLDRDGTIIVDQDYLGDPEEVVLLDRACEALKLAQDAGYLLIIVTNQSGIARGYFSERDADRVDEQMCTLLAQQGVTIAQIYRCPHHPEGLPPYNIACTCRKPQTGLFRQAILEHDIDPLQSIACGDKRRDIERLGEVGIPEERLGVIGKRAGEYSDLFAFFQAMQDIK